MSAFVLHVDEETALKVLLYLLGSFGGCCGNTFETEY